MRHLHIHLHLARELLADAQSAIHLHIKPEGPAPDLQQAWSPAHLSLPSGAPPLANHAYGVTPSGGIQAAGELVSGQTAAVPQRIRSKVYRLEFVPTDPSAEQQASTASFAPAQSTPSLLLELASGNQYDPIAWEAFEPDSERGLWRFSVREDFGRLVGLVTYARDPNAIWVLSAWTPRGSLVLEPADRQRYPRLMLTPIPAFQK